MKLSQLFTFLLVIYFCKCTNCHISSSPKIQIDRLTNFTNGSFPFTKKLVFYAPSIGGELFITCQSQLPIRWSFDGIVTPIDLVKVGPVGRQSSETAYKIRANMHFYDARAHSNLGASLRVSCHLENDTSIADELFVFVQGHTNNSLIWSENQEVLYDTFVIPCLTKNPEKTPQLYFVGDQGDEKLAGTAIHYEPTMGFVSNKAFLGSYICRQDLFSLSFQAARNPVPPNNFAVFPKRPTIRTFTDRNIRIECQSKNGTNIYLKFNHGNGFHENVTIRYESNTTELVIAVLSFGGDQSEYNGRIKCFSDQLLLIWQWTLNLVKAPELYIDNFNQELQCLTSASRRKIETVWCKNPLDCEYKERCFQDNNSCNFKQIEKFSSSYHAKCWQEKYQTIRQCAFMPTYHLHGYVRCSVARLSKQWEYFTGLNFQKYTFWKDAPVGALMRIEKKDDDSAQTGKLSTFYCLASSYLFTKELTFQIKFRNGSYISPQGISVEEKVTSGPGENAPFRIRGWNFVQQLDMVIPEEAVQLECVAQWWNSTQVMNVTRIFK